MPTDRRSRLAWALALTCGLLLRAVFVLRYPRLTADGQLYGDLAINLLTRHTYGFTVADALPRPTLIRLPGYPLFLAGCFRLFGLARYTAVLWVQVGVDLVACSLLARVTRRLFGARAGWFALWLAVLCPFTANYVATPLTETLTLASIALAFFSLERWAASLETRRAVNPWLLLLAFALASSLLLRPEQGLLSAAVVPAVLWIGCRRARSLARGLAPGLLVASLTLAPLLPWTARNWHVFHIVQPLAPRFANDPGERNPAGFERWFRTWATGFAATDEVYWNYDSAPIDPASLPSWAFDTPDQHRRTLDLLADYNQTTTASDALDERFAALARERVASHPLRFYALLPVARLGDMLLRPRLEMLPFDTHWFAPRTRPAATAFAMAYGALNLAYLVAAALALLRLRDWIAPGLAAGVGPVPRLGLGAGPGPAPAWGVPVLFAMLATVVLRSALLLTLDNSEPRYTLEFYPVLIPLAAVALAYRRDLPAARR